jgi:hypothetical protein
MKKLTIISNQIKNNTYSYTGKGSFEAIVNNYKSLIIEWLEDLIPLQKQIELLNEKEDIVFQKRNYTRILTKLLPEEYTEFVSINILTRDSNIIGQYYQKEYNLTILYDKLVENKYLKYPGKYDKFVEFELFQKFLMIYRDELITNDQPNDQNNKIQENTTKPNPKKEVPTEKKKENKTKEAAKSNDMEQLTMEELIKEKPKKETNWTNLLLGKLK